MSTTAAIHLAHAVAAVKSTSGTLGSVGAIGDSLAVAYRLYPPDRDRTHNWVEILHTLRKWLFTAMLVAVLASGASGQPASPAPKPVLHLANGKSTPGDIRPSTRPGVFRWQAVSSGSESDFAWSEVNAIEWPPVGKPPKPTGELCFELAAGDMLFGSLVAVGGEWELDVPRLGRIHVQRSKLYRVCRLGDESDLVYLGPNGLFGWREPVGGANWRQDSGRPTTDRENASIGGDFGLPECANIEFEVSWKSKPDFQIALGVDGTKNTVQRAFRFEAWGNDLVIQRELKEDADLAIVQEIARGPGRAHLVVYIDQKKGRLTVFSPDGKRLAGLTVADKKPVALSGLYLANLRGDICLERLRISRWNGELPRDLGPGPIRIARRDGSIIHGQLVGMHAGSKEFFVKTDTGASQVPENTVSSLVFPLPKADGPRTMRAVYQDGSRVSGQVVGVEDGSVVFAVPGIQAPLRLSMSGLRSLVVLRREVPDEKNEGQREPRRR